MFRTFLLSQSLQAGYRHRPLPSLESPGEGWRALGKAMFLSCLARVSLSICIRKSLSELAPQKLWTVARHWLKEQGGSACVQFCSGEGEREGSSIGELLSCVQCLAYRSGKGITRLLRENCGEGKERHGLRSTGEAQIHTHDLRACLLWADVGWAASTWGPLRYALGNSDFWIVGGVKNSMHQMFLACPAFLRRPCEGQWLGGQHCNTKQIYISPSESVELLYICVPRKTPVQILPLPRSFLKDMLFSLNMGCQFWLGGLEVGFGEWRELIRGMMPWSPASKAASSSRGAEFCRLEVSHNSRTPGPTLRSGTLLSTHPYSLHYNMETIILSSFAGLL